MPKHLGENAVVIGGSIAGLMTARVLADYFEQVIVLERDHIAEEPAVHKSIPQGNHLHALLVGGERVLSGLYPGFTDKLKDLGALPGGGSSAAASISNNGLVAGLSQNGEIDPLLPAFSLPPFPEIRAVLWRNGQIIDLGTLQIGRAHV